MAVALCYQRREPPGAVQLGTGTRPTGPRRVVQVNGAEAPAVRLGEWLSIGWLTPGDEPHLRRKRRGTAALS